MIWKEWIKWKECVHWPNELYVRDAGVVLRVGQRDDARWVGVAAIDIRWFGSSDTCESRGGPARKTRDAAQADAVRLGYELAEDTLRAALEMAKAWGVDVEE